jgi:spore coat protein U-like protein
MHAQGRASSALRAGTLPCLPDGGHRTPSYWPEASADRPVRPGGTETGQLTVTATVLSGCTLIGGTLDFGTYIAGQPKPLSMPAAQIGYVNCTGVAHF